MCTSHVPRITCFVNSISLFYFIYLCCRHVFFSINQHRNELRIENKKTAIQWSIIQYQIRNPYIQPSIRPPTSTYFIIYVTTVFIWNSERKSTDPFLVRWTAIDNRIHWKWLHNAIFFLPFHVSYIHWPLRTKLPEEYSSSNLLIENWFGFGIQYSFFNTVFYSMNGYKLHCVVFHCYFFIFTAFFFFWILSELRETI